MSRIAMFRDHASGPLETSRLATAGASALAVAAIGGLVVLMAGMLVRNQRLGAISDLLPATLTQLAASAADDDARIGLAMAAVPHAIASAVYRRNPVGFGLMRTAVAGDIAVPGILEHALQPEWVEPTVAHGEPVLVLDAPFVGNGAGHVRIVRALDDVESNVAEVRWILAAGIAGIALFVGFAVDRSRRRARIFLRGLAHSMQQVTNEASGCRIEPIAGGELDVVARHFNLMARALEQSREHGRQRAAELEGRVLERTAELERANAALRTLDVAKDTFLSNVTHELRTPLTSILAAAEILQSSEGTGDGERGEFAHIVGHEARRLLSMIEQIIDAVQLEAATVQLHNTRIDLRALVATARDGIIARAAERGIQVLLRGDDRAVEVEADDVRLLGVIDMLLDNGVKFSPRGGTVELDLRAVGDQAEIRVLDEGPGIPRELAQQVFEPFAQNQRSLVDKPTGMGLGLPRARRVVEAHGGTIDIEHFDGFGACFVVRLPLVRTALVRARGEDSAAVATPTPASARVRS